MKKVRLVINKEPVKKIEKEDKNTIILKLEKLSNFEYMLNNLLDTLRIDYTNSKTSKIDKLNSIKKGLKLREIKNIKLTSIENFLFWNYNEVKSILSAIESVLDENMFIEFEMDYYKVDEIKNQIEIIEFITEQRKLNPNSAYNLQDKMIILFSLFDFREDEEIKIDNLETIFPKKEIDKRNIVIDNEIDTQITKIEEPVKKIIKD